MKLSLFSLSLKNLRRRAGVSLAIFACMAVLSGTLLTVSVFYVSVDNAIRKGSARLGADAVAVPAASEGLAREILITGAPSEFYMNSEAKRRILSEPGVEAASGQLFIVSAPLACCTVSDTVLIGFDPESDFTVTPWLKETLGKRLSDEEVIAGADILAGLGGRLKFYGHEFRVAGKLQPTGMRLIDSAVFVPMEGARRMIAESGEHAMRLLEVGPEEISAVLIKFKEGAGREETAIRLEQSMPGIKIILSSDVLREARENITLPLKAVLAAGVLQWASSLLLIGIIHHLSLAQRRGETAILRALGASKSDVLRLYLDEIIAISASGSASGLLLGAFLSAGFKDFVRAFFGVPFLLPPPSDILLISSAVFALTLLSALASTFYSTLQGIRPSPPPPP